MTNSTSLVASQAVPSNFPLPSHHPWIRLSGLHSWFRGLNRADSHVFHRFLLGVDTDYTTPTEVSYLQPILTTNVLAVYDMSTANDRLSFDSLVRWTGLPDARPPPLPSSGAREVPARESSESGFYCYGVLFRDTVLDEVKERLGVNPWASAVAAELLSAPGVWSDDRFLLQLGLAPGPSPRGSPAFVQAHVVRSDRGLSVRQLIPHLGSLVRLGATDLAAALSIAEQSEAPTVKSAFDLRPKGVSHRMTFGVYGIVGADVKKHPSIAFSPMSTPALALILGVYESVRLESANFVVTVDKGSSNAVWCAMVAAGTTLTTVDDWYAAPVMATVDGSDNGVVRGSFEMPTVTMFAREYRAAVIGNPPAKFVFSYSGAAETVGTVQGLFTVTVSGQRLLNRINVGGSTPVAAMRNLAKSVQGELEYEVDDCDLAPPTASASEKLAFADDDERE